MYFQQKQLELKHPNIEMWFRNISRKAYLFIQWKQKNNIYIYIHIYIYTSSWEMDTATRVQILDETDCISHSTNTLGKGMNPIIFTPAIGK